MPKNANKLAYRNIFLFLTVFYNGFSTLDILYGVSFFFRASLESAETDVDVLEARLERVSWCSTPLKKKYGCAYMELHIEVNSHFQLVFRMDLNYFFFKCLPAFFDYSCSLNCSFVWYMKQGSENQKCVTYYPN